jgi:molybdopterin synthase sulfur carrier subunit
MSIRVQIPAPLRSLTGGADEVSVEAADLAGLIEALEGRHKGLKDRLCDASGNLRSYVRVFVNDEDVRFLQEKATVLKAGDVVAIVPAIAGGIRARHGRTATARFPISAGSGAIRRSRGGSGWRR